jgi:hypothetical protein
VLTGNALASFPDICALQRRLPEAGRFYVPMPFIQRGTIATLRKSIHICADAKEMRPMYLLRIQ